jgi:hypothetical protein
LSSGSLDIKSRILQPSGRGAAGSTDTILFEAHEMKRFLSCRVRYFDPTLFQVDDYTK